MLFDQFGRELGPAKPRTIGFVPAAMTDGSGDSACAIASVGIDVPDLDGASCRATEVMPNNPFEAVQKKYAKPGTKISFAREANIHNHEEIVVDEQGAPVKVRGMFAVRKPELAE